MILHIEHVSIPAPFHLTLRFDDGDERTVDVEPLLRDRRDRSDLSNSGLAQRR